MRKWTKPNTRTEHFVFLLFEQFSNQVLANALEPLRAANTFLGRTAYTWDLASVTGEPVHSSAGMQVVPNIAFPVENPQSNLVLLPSYGYRQIATPSFLRQLKAASNSYARLVGVDGGAWALAAAGLLDGYRATIHMDEFDAFSEKFPEVFALRSRWIDDGDRMTAGGAISAFELMMNLVAEAHGTALTLRIAALFAAVDSNAPNPLEPPRGDVRLRRALATMEGNIETPVPIAELAGAAGCTHKDLERRFHRTFGASPRKVYQRIRLNTARNLIETSSMSLSEVSTRVGYSNASAFSRAFREAFGQSPRSFRSVE